jgi:2-keto-4-pentenoate hydratase/2-oxohepta-3-ene-1,7-dioic acid hydratase in catechol pathway
LDGRATVITDAGAVDVATASDGSYGPHMSDVLDNWTAFVTWARESVRPSDGTPFSRESVRAPSPEPRQVFAIGLNYAEHAEETGMSTAGQEPAVFTKFPACITGPYGDIILPRGGNTDWEVELVVIVGQRAWRVSADAAWEFVAGVSVGQDLSERRLQMAADPPQFSLAKSFPRFGPIGPWLVTPDELPDRDDLHLSCRINGELVQEGSTRNLIYSVPDIIRRLSSVVPLNPGDVIFTGTPGGVGMARSPQRWLQEGDELTSEVRGVGQLCHRFTYA